MYVMLCGGAGNSQGLERTEGGIRGTKCGAKEQRMLARLCWDKVVFRCYWKIPFDNSVSAAQCYTKGFGTYGFAEHLPKLTDV